MSRTSTTAAYPPSSARSTALSTNSCVTGLMSLSRWTARTRGAVLLRENARRGRERSENEREGEKSPQTTAWHRCKDSISGGSAPLPAKSVRVTLDPRAPHSSPPSPSLSSRCCRARRARVADCARRRRSSCREAVSRPSRRLHSVAIHARRRPLARVGDGRLPDALASRGAGVRGATARPRTRTAPTRAPGNAARRGWRIGNPWWVGDSDRIEARVVGDVTRVRAHLVWSPETRIPLRVPELDGDTADRAAVGVGCRRDDPACAADLRDCESASRSSTTRPASNDYTRAEAAAIVKGIQLFHVQGNGWNDIGYNFLVDRFGTIYEGRFGGIDRNVVGAHALGFNTGSVGIALLGTYEDRRRRPRRRTRSRGSSHGGSTSRTSIPTSFLTFVSGGSERYAAGVPVLLKGVSGHRDTGFTACPGDVALRAARGDRRGGSQAIGGLKIFEPKAEVRGTAIRVRARLSQAQSWAVAIDRRRRRRGGAGHRDRDGGRLDLGVGRYARGRRTGGRSRPAPRVRRRAFSVAEAARRRSRSRRVVAEPEAISPNGDGQADATTLTYRISAPANVTVEVTDEIGECRRDARRPRLDAGRAAARVEIDGARLADGDYNVVVTARTAAGASVQTVVPLSVNRTLGLVTATPLRVLAERRRTQGPPDADVHARRRRPTCAFASSATDGGSRARSPGASSPGRSASCGTARARRVSCATASTRPSSRRRRSRGRSRSASPSSSDTTAPRVRILPGKRLRGRGERAGCC